MKTIYDDQLFADLEKKTEWATLFDADFCPKNPSIPILAGGLDHISKTKKYFTFHDIGCNGRDNSFRISRKEKKTSSQWEDSTNTKRRIS